MSYVDAFHDKDRDCIQVVERRGSERSFTEYPARYTFYYKDARGRYTSIFGDKLNRISVNTLKNFQKEKKIHGHKKLFESDINPVFKCLEEHYISEDAPVLHKCFFDIEVDFNKDKGFADPSDPFNPVTAVALNLSWLQKTICIAIKPKGMDTARAQEIMNKFPDSYLMETEEELLDTFLELIEDADILTGWNSEGFDIPYMVNRIARVIGKEHTRRFCLWNKYPRKREYEKYGKDQETFDLYGRVHLDYLELYRKYTYHEMHSYSLDAIGEYELGERKTAYEGTLDQLYNNDFETFIEYNRQDVELIVRMDAKLQFIDLANVLAHANTVLLPTTMGAVAVTDQAIVNEAHRLGKIVPDRSRDGSSYAAAGAYVAWPKKGWHEWIGSIDLNSLYPSIIRACNMSTETIVGQLRQTRTNEGIESTLAQRSKGIADYWDGKFATVEYELVMDKDTTEIIKVDFENGDHLEGTGAELYDLFFHSGQPWILTANGTLFNTENKGIIPNLLERWYSERKEMQKKAKTAQSTNKIEFEYWDKRQLVKKINLNSLYGAILNPGSRFFDQRLGQSTTLTGRCIARHMAAQLNKVIADNYDHTGDAIVYGDTDSAYFSAYPILKPQIDAGEIQWNKDTAIQYYDAVCEQVNETFPGFMKRAFGCPGANGKIIAAARETCATAGIFIKKKRYAIMVYDNEGYREDGDDKPGKVKAMGLDLKRSDTPAFMQDYLKELLILTLTGGTEEQIIDSIKEFRTAFRERPGWEKGTPKRVNNLTKHTNVYEKTGKCSIGHAMAAINWNRMRKMNSDAYSLEITDGMKTIVCKLKDNPLKMNSIAFPIDAQRIPDWFQSLPFDHDAMEDTIIDNKVENLLGVLNFDLGRSSLKNTFESLFSFD